MCRDGLQSTYPKNGRHRVPLTCMLPSPSPCRLNQFHLSLPPCSERQVRHRTFTGRCFAGAATFAPAVSGPPVGDLRPRRTQFLLRQLCKDERVRTGVSALQQHGQSALFEGAHSNRLPPFLLCNLSFIVLCFLLYFLFQLFPSIVFAQLFVSPPPFFLIFQKNDLLFQPFEDEI